MTHAPTHETSIVSASVSHVNGDGLRHLSTDEFRQFGLPVLAYLREVATADGTAGYVIHAADGSVLVEVDDIDTAVELAGLNKIILVGTQ
jgi:hypothetical protein